MTTPQNPVFLATAVEIVLRAGEIQMAKFGRAVAVSKKGDIDLVTEVDVAVERMFRQVIADRFPAHGILAEEMGGSHEPVTDDAPYRWIFDPLDGTTNYAHRLPIFCASLALEAHDVPIVAAVYDPTRKELFTAERGSGAFLNGQPLRVSSSAPLGNALLVTGFPYDVHQTADEVVGLFGDFITRARAVRRLGSAALDLCYVAAGRMDGFWEQRLKAWDIAAGALIVEEAGGTVSGLRGESFRSRLGQVVASNGLIHGEMIETITRFLDARR
jgi:myo-inositol-1(or 4)-monophosphatase